MRTELYFIAELKLETALHIGTGKGGEPTDSPLRRTNNGRIMIPGRAIGGSLRTTATRIAPRLGHRACWALSEKSFDDLEKQFKRKYCGCIVCELFGELYPSEDEPDTDSSEDESSKKNLSKGGRASRLWISDAFAQVNEPQTSVRDGVGIDRVNGAAAHNVKFDYEVVPRNTVFELRLRLVDKDEGENEKQRQEHERAAANRAKLLRATLAEWKYGRGRLGSSAARGLGKFALNNLRVKETNIVGAAQLIGFLKEERRWNGASDETWLDDSTFENFEFAKAQDDVAAKSFVSIQLNVQLSESFLVNDPLVSALAGFDHAPLLEVNFPKAGAPVLSGSSLRGALRSRAEKIARTLSMLHWKTAKDFLEHCAACNPFVKAKDGELASCDARLTIPDENETPEDALCMACQLFGSPRRGSRLWIEDAEWKGEAPNQDSWHAQDFLAIDRFTGGGQEHAKFDAAPLTQAKFQTRLTLHNPKPWELGWLILVLRDLGEGEMTLGFGAAKGYGRATANGFEWTIGYITDDDFPNVATLAGEVKREGIYSIKTAPPSERAYPDAWTEAATEWVKKFNETVEKFQTGEHKDENWQLFEKDSFLGNDDMVKHYGMPRVTLMEDAA